jgi:hypothetical protein
LGLKNWGVADIEAKHDGIEVSGEDVIWSVPRFVRVE